MKYLSIFFLLFFSLSLTGQKTASPYLEILTEGANIPLKESRADVHIAGTIAHVHITQVYHNQGTEAIEAKYVFPLSTQAAVHKMDMTIGDRTVHAKIFEKQKAQEVYQEAIKEGKRAAKLDQERPNVFQMSVGNILPNDEIAIDLYYTEMLVPLAGSYQFVLPGVVGPRFTGESGTAEPTFAQGYTAAGTGDSFKFDLSVAINAGMLIQHIASTSHQIDIHYPRPTTAEIGLSTDNENPANRDFILDYSLRGNKIQSGLLLYEHDDEKFFAYMMEPLKTPKLEQIPAREYLFIVDVSGSMNGYPLEVSKELMQNLLCNLRETDVFNILLFASSSVTFQNTPVAANTENITAALKFLSQRRGGGGTRLLNALKKAYGMPRKDSSSARSMVVITDGYVSVEKEAFKLIEENLNQASVFTFGIGSNVNRYLIEGMAKVGRSESFIATKKEEAFEVAKELKKYVDTPLLTQVQLETEGFEIYDVEPKSIPDVLSSRPVVIYGKWKGEPTGKILVSGYQGGGSFKATYNVADGTVSKANKALRYLWARKRIEQLDDYNTLFYEDTRQEVTKLGLNYNLLTRFTSFVAVDHEVANKEGRPKVVKQPLPMPENVNDYAVGAEASVEESSLFTKTFKIEITVRDGTLVKMEERQLKMWFRTNYAELIKKLQSAHKELKVYLKANGSIQKVEKLEQGQWVEDTDLQRIFSEITSKPLSSKREVIIHLN